MSELKMLNGNKKLIVCFGGKAIMFGGILPFEFLNYLSSQYKNEYDLVFYVDKKQCWYHKGIDEITTTIDETVHYLNNLIREYESVLFMGTSAGGYAAILFGSLCKVNRVISFIPQTILTTAINTNYSNLKYIIHEQTNYCLYGDTSIHDINDVHHISHCENLQDFKNVTIIKKNTCNMKSLRDSGFIKNLIDNFF